MTAFDYEFGKRLIYNEAVITGYKRVATANAYVWGTQDRPRIGAGQSISLYAKLSAPASGITLPVANTDWKANTDIGGGGVFLTASVIITGYQDGQSVLLILQNNATQPVYIIPGTSDPNDTLRIQGTLYDEDQMQASQNDATSGATYGARSISVDCLHKGNANDLISLAIHLVGKYKNPRAETVAFTIKNSSDALLTQILTRQLSDRITVTCAALGISSKDYFINKMVHSISEGGTVHEVKFFLERASDNVYWLLGKAGYSELGTTTRLGF